MGQQEGEIRTVGSQGTKGGIIILWDSSIWEGEVCEVGAYCITVRFLGKTQDFSWHLSGVYGPNDREERKEVWWELGAVRSLFDGPWVIAGDFNVVRSPSEKKNCIRINKAMEDFSDFIEDMELEDPPLIGGSFTWRKGDNYDTAARLDRFLFSEEWEVSFRKIKQTIMPRVTSDHNPLLLECGNWEGLCPILNSKIGGCKLRILMRELRGGGILKFLWEDQTTF
uniref:Putative ovule protein n=1 Tax=Solanum chacoense TaxID=4108 RepID=A0A0V0IIJ0_SOLCH